MVDWMNVLTSSFSEMFGPFAAIYAIAAIGLNIHFGYTGLLNFAQVSFMMVGAYGMEVAIVQFGASWTVGVFAGLLCAVVLALILGIPTLRLRGDYLAIATIAAGEALRILFESSWLQPLTRGNNGIHPPKDVFGALNPFNPGKIYDFGIVKFQGRDLWIMTVAWPAVLILCYLVYRLMKSPWGRVMRSVREDELAARSLGKNVYGFKMQSLVLGGVLGGLAGVIWVLKQPAQFPSLYDPRITFYLWVIMILGGAGRILGPLLGTVIFYFLFSFLGTLLPQLFPNFNVGPARIAIVGLLLMLLMIFRPAGILGSREEMRLEAR